jgi:hypothetical protein
VEEGVLGPTSVVSMFDAFVPSWKYTLYPIALDAAADVPLGSTGRSRTGRLSCLGVAFAVTPATFSGRYVLRALISCGNTQRGWGGGGCLMGWLPDTAPTALQRE